MILQDFCFRLKMFVFLYKVKYTFYIVNIGATVINPRYILYMHVFIGVHLQSIRNEVVFFCRVNLHDVTTFSFHIQIVDDHTIVNLSWSRTNLKRMRPNKSKTYKRSSSRKRKGRTINHKLLFDN